MATFYLILIIVLFILAISDLIVGVSNDAVNFLNSAVGARAAPFKTIMFVAALGVLVGATFSSGMMEVARKGIFHPEYFYFSEIIILFLAVMVTDVILLDTFNTFGMPTSTTVSIVFELLGAAVAISMIKIFTDPNALGLFEYINSAKALAIISGILLSVVMAFTCGMIAQYLSRLMFSFNYQKRMKSFGAIWGGLGIMAITYFMLIKGAKGASFMSESIVNVISNNTMGILLGSLVGWTFLLYIANRVFHIDILKILVLVGTFALAMAFAGNDLVNFIGVPLAGYNSYQIFMDSGTGADQLLMDGLAGKVPTPTMLLLMAGVIMVVTLYTSKKARSVVQTSLDLGRQDEGAERFSSFLLSRTIVRITARIAKFLEGVTPQGLKNHFSRQFDQRPFDENMAGLGKEAPSFDMLRASVTLVVASILIAIGTNLKLPLSTTYVTFMVFMGTSLADGAWGRESAVYRVSGVLSVIGGWFFTAFSAFLVAFVLALLFHFAGMAGIGLMLIVSAIVIYRSHRYHAEKMQEQLDIEKSMEDDILSKEIILHLCKDQLNYYFSKFKSQIDLSFKGLRDEDLEILNQTHQSNKKLQKRIDKLRVMSSKTLDKVPEHDLEAGHVFVLFVDYLKEMNHGATDIIKTNLDHVNNHHKPLLKEQIDELLSLHDMLCERYSMIVDFYSTENTDIADRVYDHFDSYFTLVRNMRKKQIKRVKSHEVGTRNSLLYLNHLAELRNMAIFSNRIVRILDDFLLRPQKEGDIMQHGGE